MPGNLINKGGIPVQQPTEPVVRGGDLPPAKATEPVQGQVGAQIQPINETDIQLNDDGTIVISGTQLLIRKNRVQAPYDLLERVETLTQELDALKKRVGI